jgi:hypothetical protein
MQIGWQRIVSQQIGISEDRYQKKKLNLRTRYQHRAKGSQPFHKLKK